jgi:hypothetical protein
MWRCGVWNLEAANPTVMKTEVDQGVVGAQMSRNQNDFVSLIVVVAIGCVIIAAISAPFHGHFIKTFLYSFAAVTTLTSSIIGTLYLFAFLGRNWAGADSAGYSVIAWITGIFVTTPAALGIVYWGLKHFI